MDLFFVILGLLLLAFPIIAIVALVKVVGLGDRLRRLETRLTALEGRPPARAQAAPELLAPVSPPLQPDAPPELAPVEETPAERPRLCPSRSRRSPPLRLRHPRSLPRRRRR